MGVTMIYTNSVKGYENVSLQKNSIYSTRRNSRNLVGIGLYRLNFGCLSLVGSEGSKISFSRYIGRNSTKYLLVGI